MTEVFAAGALLALAVIGFVVAVRVGMLVGRGLDRFVDSRSQSSDVPAESNPGGQTRE